ncbi:hypothetical protein LINPERPRIM_LOCUS36100, partial [Linum perenne]
MAIPRCQKALVSSYYTENSLDQEIEGPLASRRWHSPRSRITILFIVKLHKGRSSTLSCLFSRSHLKFGRRLLKSPVRVESS